MAKARSRSKHENSEFLRDNTDDAAGALIPVFPRPEQNLILELYLRELLGRLFNEVQSVYLFGSGALADLAPPNGDLDLVVVCTRPPASSAANELTVVHRYVSSEGFAPWGQMIDASYYSLATLADPAGAGIGLRGSKEGVKATDSLHLTPIERIGLAQHGVRLMGEDLRPKFAIPPWEAVYEQVKAALDRARGLGDGASGMDHSAVATGLVRGLHALTFKQIVSKTQAIRWLSDHYPGPGAEVAQEANRIRRAEHNGDAGAVRRGFPKFLELMDRELALRGPGTYTGR